MAYRDPADSDAALIAELVARATRLPLAGGDPEAARGEIARFESELGFALPPLLRRVYVEVANGGIGPDYSIYPLVDLVATYRQFRDDEWPERLLPLADMGCGEWWCLDCRSDVPLW